MIFGIFGVHQLTPHHHHSLDHDTQDKDHHHVAEHTHGHGQSADHHHHHDADQQPESDEGGLSGLLDNHTHTGETIDFLLTSFVHKHNLQFKILVDDLSTLSQEALEDIPLLEVRRVGYPPPERTEAAFLISSQLRGPPQIA